MVNILQCSLNFGWSRWLEIGFFIFSLSWPLTFSQSIKRKLGHYLLEIMWTNEHGSTYRSTCCVKALCPWCLTCIKIILVLRCRCERGMAGRGGNHHKERGWCFWLLIYETDCMFFLRRRNINYHFAYSQYWSLYISKGAVEENLFNNQELL